MRPSKVRRMARRAAERKNEERRLSLVPSSVPSVFESVVTPAALKQRARLGSDCGSSVPSTPSAVLADRAEATAFLLGK
jgi:hypothetical protein